MATYNFTESGDNFSLAVNGTTAGTWPKWDGKDIVDCPISLDLNDAVLVLSIGNRGVVAAMEATDTLQIAGVTQSAGLAAFAVALKNHMTTSSGGSSSGAATALKLTAPDSTVYEVTVNNAGALVTTVSTAGGSAATSLILTAPNSTQYQVTVNNDGALITTAI